MTKKYAYVFPLTMPDGTIKLEWSKEDYYSLPKRASTERDRNLILDFMGPDWPGSFIKMSTGEMVFQIV